MNYLKFVFRIPKQPRTPFCELPEYLALPWCRVVMGSTADHDKLFSVYVWRAGAPVLADEVHIYFRMSENLSFNVRNKAYVSKI